MKFNEKGGTIEGRITDKSTGKPLFGVHVAVDGKDLSARTDIRGRFMIPSVEAGACVLRCNLAGYKPTTGLTMKVEHSTVSKCDCHLVPKGTISLNEPVVMLPLRLEIRKHILPSGNTISVTNVAKYTSNAATDSAISAQKFSPFKVKSQIEPAHNQDNEYWIRWYPDDIHYLTPVGKITEEEAVAWKQFYSVYEKHKDLGSVKGLYTRDPYNLSIESLEIFYDISPGRLTIDELSRCKEYNKAALMFILDEEVGVREALGWQDTENPEIKSVWTEFAKKFGPVRARQIAKAVLDKNWDYDTEIDEEDPMEILLDQGISLPTLPEEICLYTINNSKVERLVDNITINRENLVVAPTDLEGALWMTDFSKAVEAGMGIIINDPKKISQIDQADWLIVVGLNDTEDSRKVLEEILCRNNASGELAILAQDSPTNNTDSVATPYTGLEVEAEEYLRNTRMKIPKDNVPIGLSAQIKTNTLDAHKLTSIFKLANSTLSEMPEADLAEMTEAGAMAALLWTPCTLLFEKTWGKEYKQNFPAGFQNATKFSLGNFFIQNVRARGTLPILRVGENPYGILPIVSLRDWCDNLSRHKEIAGQETDILCAAINTLKDKFLELAKETPRVDQEDDGIYEKLLEMLRYSPVSKRVDVRAFDSKQPDVMAQDSEYLNCPLVKDKINENVQRDDIPYPEIAYLDDLSRINRTDFNPACFKIDSKSSLLKRIIKHLLWLIFGAANEPSKCELKGKVVDRMTGKILPNAMVKVKAVEFTAETDIRGEFVISDIPSGIHDIEVLHSEYTGLRNVNVVINPHLLNKVDFNLSPKSNTTRHIAANRPAQTKVSKQPTKAITGKVLDSKSGKVIAGARVSLKGTSKSVLTNNRGEYTIDDLSAGDHQIETSTAGYGSSTFSVSINDLLPIMEVDSKLAPVNENFTGNSNTAGLNIPGGLELIADAANLLKRIHPDKVEILLIETLDLLSHRLDAWLTGLANSRLIECQRDNSKPPPLGVYGWLEKPGSLDTAPPTPEFIQAPSVKQATTAAILRNASINNGTDDNSGAFQVNLSSSQVRKGLWYLESLRQGHLPGEILGYRLERMIHDEGRKNTSQITDSDIYSLRDKYPLNLHANRDDADESVSELTIIDGEKFLEKNNDLKFTDIKNKLNQIKDAATDIAMCEVINADDNIASRAAWLDFLDGKCLPPTEEFVRSQQTGDIHGTKVFLQMSSPENIEAYESSTNPRVIADPILAHFCDSLMPDLGLKEIEVKLSNVNEEKSRSITFFARELNMDAIDLVIGGVEELRLRARYYLLSCWRETDPADTSATHPCNILGSFPDFEKTDDLLNEIGIEITPPLSCSDSISIFTCIEKAKLICSLIHQNRSKNSLGTVHPKELPIINPAQLEQLDPLAGVELLSNRLRKIRNQLVNLIYKAVKETSELKGRHITLKGLRECRRAVLLLKEKIQSSENEALDNESIDFFAEKIIHLIESDPDFNDLAEGAHILLQINQLKNGSDNAIDQIEAIHVQILDLESKFNVFIESSAKVLVTNANIPLFEISQFGLEKALSIFPNDPTVEGSFKIIRLFDQLVVSLIEKVNSLVLDSSDLQNAVQCLKVVYLNGAEVDQILFLHSANQEVAKQQLRNRLPLTEPQSQIILDNNFQSTHYFEPLVSLLLDSMTRLSQIATYYENYLTSTRIVLINDPEGVYQIVKTSKSDALNTLVNFYGITAQQAQIILDFKLEILDNYDVTQIRELIVSTSNNKISEIISLLQAVTDKDGMVILTPYLLTKGNSNRPKWDVDFTELVDLGGPTYLQEYGQVRPAIAKLYDLFNVGNELVIHEDKYFQRLDPSELSYKKEGITDYLYLTTNGESLYQEECLTFLLLDQWQEGIPNPEQSENTGVAIRYESPQAEAPNAIIIAVPPYRSSTEYWSMDLLANTLLETLELMQVRMVNSNEVIGDVIQWLPSLLFDPANDGEPLFPSRKGFFHDFDIGANSGYVLASQLSKSELSKTKAPTVRNETPKTGRSHEK